MPFVENTLHCALAVLQAGGGGSFGGGGGGGFGGGGGGDGDGIAWLVYYLFRLIALYPRIGVPLLILFLVLGYLGSRKGWWKHQERTIRRSRRRRRTHASAVSAAALREDDPRFDQQRFLSRVRVAFDKAQSSWCEQDLEPLRPFVSDGVFERFSLQIEEQKEDGWRQGMLDLKPGRLSLVHVEAGVHFDTVTVRIPFDCNIHRLSLRTGKRIPGSRLPRTSFVECWSFLRRRGAKTLAGEGLIEGKCPNCGAPLTMNQSARCGSCECLARSGQFDWVLAEITQESVWRAEHEEEIVGLQDYLVHDPGMSVQMLEDRASVAFWRKCAADRAGRIEPLTRVADEDLCNRYGERLRSTGERSYDGDCAVGSVNTLGVAAGVERDHALVEVVWDGRRARVDATGRRRLDEKRRLRRTLFVFGRETGQRSRLDEAFTTAHCRTCGAHDLGGTEPACPYCGSPRTGDRGSWLLAEILHRYSPEARAWITRLESGATARRPVVQASASELSPAGLLGWAAALVRADGRIDERERRAVHSLAERGETPREHVDAILDGSFGVHGIGAEVPEPRDPEEARSWLGSLARIAIADGGLSRTEKYFLRQAGERLGVRPRELERAIRSARKSLFRDSRAARRHEKQHD